MYIYIDPEDMTEEEVMAKVKKSSGANYDLGSNAKGYESKAGNNIYICICIHQYIFLCIYIYVNKGSCAK